MALGLSQPGVVRRAALLVQACVSPGQVLELAFLLRGISNVFGALVLN